MALIHCDFFSEVLQLQTSLCAIIPQPSFLDTDQSDTDHKYKTLYLLHGLSDNHTIWQRFTSVERYAPPDLAIIMPDVNRSFYADMAHGNRYWTFVSEELPAICRSLFPLADAREDNFVAGLSMGGYGAFKLALSHPNRFAAAASLSGVLDVARIVRGNDEAWLAEMRSVFGDLDKVAGSEHDLFHLARELADGAEAPPALYQCCGTEDDLYRQNIRFRDFATSWGLELSYEEGPGKHDWGYWDQQIQRVLAWLPL